MSLGMRMEDELKPVVSAGDLGNAPGRIYQTPKAPIVEAVLMKLEAINRVWNELDRA